MLLRALLIWLVLLVLAVMNGAARDGLISPRLGEHAGHLIGTVIRASLIFLTSWLVIPWIGLTSARQAWAVGVLWVLLTVGRVPRRPLSVRQLLVEAPC